MYCSEGKNSRGVSVQGMEAYSGMMYDVRTLTLGMRCRRVISFEHRPLYPFVKGPLYPPDRKL